MVGTKRPAESLDMDEGSYIQDVEETFPFPVPRIIRRHRSRLKPPSILRLPLSQAHQDAPPANPKPEFNVFKAVLRHPNLFFQFALRLPPRAMMDLYAIDKEFHYRLNKYSVSIIHDYAAYHAPEACDVFSFVLYPELCISDPLLKPMDGRIHLARDVPGLRWTKMVIYKDKVVREILTLLGMEGHRVPRGTSKMLMKYWVLMEVKHQAAREAFLRERQIWSDEDILLFQLFSVKLDMRFADPIQGQGICELSHLLLTQKSLTPLRDMLSGKKTYNYEEIAEMTIKTYLSEDLDTETHTWLDDEVENGILADEWGLLRQEGWDVMGAPMECAVDLVIKEGIRRRLNVQQYCLDFVLYGYVDMQSGRNEPIPKRWRGEEGTVVPEMGLLLNEKWKGLIEGLHSKFTKHGVKEEDMEVKQTNPDG